MLGISGLSAASYSLTGGASVAKASAEDILEKAGFLPAAIADPRVVQYATTGALPFWVAGTFANQWQRNLDFYQLPQSLINRYRYAGAAYRSLDDASSIWRTIPKQYGEKAPMLFVGFTAIKTGATSSQEAREGAISQQRHLRESIAE